jgi:hypothetical protein
MLSVSLVESVPDLLPLSLFTPKYGALLWRWAGQFLSIFFCSCTLSLLFWYGVGLGLECILASVFVLLCCTIFLWYGRACIGREEPGTIWPCIRLIPRV